MKSDYLLFPDVECRDFNISNNELESRLEGRKIGAEARFSCPRGFQLAAGPTVVKCQTNGKINMMWNPLMYEKNIALFSLEISSVHMNLMRFNSFWMPRILRELNVPFSNFPTLVCSFLKMTKCEILLLEKSICCNHQNGAHSGYMSSLDDIFILLSSISCQLLLLWKF